MPEGTLQEWWSGKCFWASSAVTVGSRNAQPFLLMDSWFSGPAWRAHVSTFKRRQGKVIEQNTALLYTAVGVKDTAQAAPALAGGSEDQESAFAVGTQTGRPAALRHPRVQ